ncbi:hypothetical protein J2Z40_003803 [Cytobacillus eiseniae]|uniref:Uncharacterized protein n=1 Tax=Cytobacillus eiseniae TaxID=762947 RepID=A0ABS4RJX8_9BACI|nr:hypothetical protein [Cytobacillus eiseniae]MBP2243215.1 hypothetical protein [Cytobacillus eiseniae]
MPVSIIFNQIAVNAISGNGTVATGQNNQEDWSVQGKVNMAAGQQIGLSAITGNLNIICDNDLVDAPINTPDIMSPQPNVQF